MLEDPHQLLEVDPDPADNLCLQLLQEVSVHLIVMRETNLVLTAKVLLHHLVMMTWTLYNQMLSAAQIAQFQEV